MLDSITYKSLSESVLGTALFHPWQIALLVEPVEVVSLKDCNVRGIPQLAHEQDADGLAEKILLAGKVGVAD